MKKIVIISLAVLAAVPFTGLIYSPVLQPAFSWIGSQSKDRVQPLKAEGHQSLELPVKTGSESYQSPAKSALLIDFDSARIMYAHNPDAKLPIASISKLATAVVILQKHGLAETVTIGSLPSYHPEAVKLNLRPGQQFSVEALLKAALIPSANDAADALAIYDSGSVGEFTKAMNELAAQWGIGDVNFTTANGLNEVNNYASARSLAKLAKVALGNKTLATIVSQASAQISDSAGQSYTLISTNRLLGNGQVVGLKTGYTPEAGQSFLGLADIKGQRVISVVLNSPDRFGETQSLYTWAELNWEWMK